MIPDTRE